MDPQNNDLILQQLQQRMPQQSDIMTMPMGSATTGKGHFKDFLLNAIGMAPSLIGRAPMSASTPKFPNMETPPSPKQLDIMESQLPPGMQDKNNPNASIGQTPLEQQFESGGMQPANTNPSKLTDRFRNLEALRKELIESHRNKYMLELMRQKQQRIMPTAEELSRNTGVKDANQPLYDFKMQNHVDTLLKTMNSATNENIIKVGAYLPKDLKDALLDINKTLPAKGHPMRAEVESLIDKIIQDQGHHPDKVSDYLNLPLKEKIDLILHGPKKPK